MLTFLLIASLNSTTIARTTADMRTIWGALNAYRVDHGAFPPGASMDDIEPFVSPLYILHLPKTDASGQPFVYETDPTRQHVRLAATGVVLQDGVIIDATAHGDSISAIIRDERGKPLSGVTVTWRSADGNTTRVISAPDGTVHIPATSGSVLTAELTGFYAVRVGPISSTAEPLNITMVARPLHRGGIKGEIRKPILINRVEPVCESTHDDPSAESILEIVVGKTGLVQDVRLAGGPATAYTRAAERAVRQWKFESATLNTQPVDVFLYVRVQGCWVSDPLLKNPRPAD